MSHWSEYGGHSFANLKVFFSIRKSVRAFVPVLENGARPPLGGTEALY